MVVIISEWTGFWLNPQSTKYAFNKLMTQLKPPSSSTKNKVNYPTHIHTSSSPNTKTKHHQGVVLCKLSPNHHFTNRKLSGVLHVIGKLSEAAPLFARALEGRETELGQHHPDTLATVNNFAVLLEATKRDPGKWRCVFFFSKKG